MVLSKTQIVCKRSKTLIGAKKPLEHSKRLIVPKRLKTIRVLLDTGSSGDLLFWEKGSTACIPVVRRAVPESCGTSNGTFQTKKVGNVEISFVDYSNIKRIHLKPDIVKYARNGAPPLYNLILVGKHTLHNLGVVLDFKEKTITIDELLPMRNINNLQLKPSISRAL